MSVKFGITVAIVLSLVAVADARELYRVTVSRVDSNVYKDHDSGAVILTKYCYDAAERMNASLTRYPLRPGEPLDRVSWEPCGYVVGYKTKPSGASQSHTALIYWEMMVSREGN